ncbi:flavodoxin, partial [Acidovorax sp.]|uniref:flavodoxin family protein n=1 Tax=Acidovorax sp. TaxID=1872122 RepID=UPI0025C1724B
MDSILVVFYSYTGVSRRAAQLIAAHYDWPMGEIRDARLRAGFLGGLRCLLDSLFRRRPAIRYEGPDPAGFRTVILISPIWAYRMAGPMRSFLAERGARIRRFAQVTLMNAVGSSQAVVEAQQLIGH